MTTLKFADTHNMVAFLAKPAESEGFKQIVDFLDAHTINSKTTAWNEFSSTMTSVIICLATNQKFNFSKFIFESMVKNLDNVSGNFLMYPRFVQVFVNQQLEGMPTHKRIYIAPYHTKKIFGNMRRVGKGFSGRETPLFQTMMVQDQKEVGEGSEMPTDPHHTPTIIQPSTSQPQKKQRSRRSKRKDTEVPQPNSPTTNVADEAVNEDMDDSLVRDATTATSLDAEQDRGTSSGSGPRCQETMGDTIAQTRFENVSKHSNDPLLARVLDLETTKTTQATEIASLKRRVKKLKRRNKLRTHGIKRLYKVGSSRRDESSKDEDMFGVNDLDGDEVIVESVDVVNTAEETRSVAEEVTAVTILSAKPKADKVVIQEPEQGTTTTPPTLTTTTAATTIIDDSTRPKAKGIVFNKQEQAPTPTVSSQEPSQVKIQDKFKGKMVEPEPVKKMSKKDLLRLEEELAFKRQAEEEEKERLAREKAQQVKKGNIAWDHVQAIIEADYQLAQKLQAQEQEELTNKEKARLFVQFLEQRRNILQLREQKKRGTNHQQELNKGVSLMKRVNTFVDYRTELVEESSKKAKLEEDKESKDLKKCLEIVPDDGDDVTIDATPLSTKSLTIVDYKIYKEGKKSYFQIMRADSNSQMYLTFGKMLKNFDREDLENMLFYLLVEKIYPLTNHTLHQMFNDMKLQVDFECEMAFELLRLVKKQLKEGYVPE
ncbi:hypothetical protein Tco_1448729 [Tanacetum coccineum]